MTEITPSMKKDNWDFFVMSKSGDLTWKITGVEALLENLVAATEIVGCHDYDNILNRCRVWVDRAHIDYYENKDILSAYRHCNAVVGELTKMIYEPEGRWALAGKEGSFKYTPQQQIGVK